MGEVAVGQWEYQLLSKAVKEVGDRGYGFQDILQKEMQKNMVWQLNGTLSLWAQQIGMVLGCT